jgi:pyruvate,water dikinase
LGTAHPDHGLADSPPPRRLHSVTFLEHIGQDEYEKLGGKAVNLGRLHRAGIDVPNGFTISCDCFTEFLDKVPRSREVLQRLEASTDIEEILDVATELEQLGGQCTMAKRIREEITAAFLQLDERVGSHDTRYAVRSSANIEDGKQVSFAGQAESFLCVNGVENIIDAVKKTWQSAISSRSVLYLHSRGIRISRVTMGVIVQEMIPAEVSGVMFTANTVTNDPSQMIVESTWGLGEPLVSGRIVPDTYVLSKNPMGVIQRTLGSKAVTAVPSKTGGRERVLLQATPQSKQESFTLGNREILKIARKGLEIEQILGCPQDIEWCIDGSRLVVVQARPITTLQP